MVMSKKTLVIFWLLASLLLAPLVMLSSVVFASASSPDTWIYAYEGTNKDRAESFIQCSDGGYVIAGETNVSTTPPRLQLWLLKTGASGIMEWKKTYGSLGSAQGHCVIQTSDGGYALAGMANYDAELIKIDAAGNTQWNRTYEDYTRAYCVIQTSDGGYALAGSMSSSWIGDDTCWLAKIDSSGGTVWSKSYAQAGLGSASAVVQTNDGGYAMIGTTQNADFLLVKTDTNGNFEWSKTYGSPDKDGGSSIVQNTDGSYVMAGLMWNRSTFSDGSSMGVGLVKADSSGNLQWLKNYPGFGSPSSMVRGSDGSYILCSGMLDKIDAEGNLLWSKNVSFTGNLGTFHAGTTYLVAQTSDGGYAVAGTISSTPSNPLDMISYVWIGKLNSEGNPATFIPEFSPIAIAILAVTVCLVAVAFRQRWLRPNSASPTRSRPLGSSAFHR
jgi:hypothetical protein